MPNKSRWRTIKRNNFDRVLVTETLPFETPIIFSGDGLYDQVSRKPPTDSISGRILSALVYLSGDSAMIRPYTYKIKKGDKEVRRLTVVHPRSQYQIRDFYKQYESLILYYCSRSSCTIRAPFRQTSSFYLRSDSVHPNSWKNGAIVTTDKELFLRYSPSFFAYRGVDRLHKFFESADFMRLEKKYDSFWSVDVSRCFDSIYTHSLSWAVKEKDFTKKNLHGHTFGLAFDKLMQSLNSRETNGVVVGPEVSRIFAEIIFQSIDIETVEGIKGIDLVHGRDYEIRRYVDDIYIFAHDDDDAGKIYNHYSNSLLKFNLQINPSKTVRLSRPFVTVKSRLTYEVSECLDEFCSHFLEVSSGNIVPKTIRSVPKLARNFVGSIKSVCTKCNATYGDVSSFVIGRMLKKAKELTNSPKKTLTDEEQLLYRDAVLLILEVSFFMYTVAPSITASYRLSTVIIIVARFAKTRLSEHYELISEEMYRMVVELVRSEVRAGRDTGTEGFEGVVSLEVINILLATQGLGPDLRLSEELATKVFDFTKCDDYFHIVTCLFYVTDDVRYSALKLRALQAAHEKLHQLFDLDVNAEKACLFLDMISCPYVAVADRKSWIDRFHSEMKLPLPTSSEVDSFLGIAPGQPWFVNWRSVEMLNLLERKELVSTY